MPRKKQQAEELYGPPISSGNEPETTVVIRKPGEVHQFVHAGGRVTATIIKLNEDGSYRMRQDGKTVYPSVRESAFLKPGETPMEHYGVKEPDATVSKFTNSATKKPGKGGSIIEQIIAHHVSGKSNKEIIALGFNKSTVARQVGEYKKKHS